MISNPTPKWAYWIISVQFILLLVTAGFSFRLRLIPIDMSYHDWIAVLLTALAVLLSVLGVFFAVLAFIGWRQLKRGVDLQVDAQTKEFLEGEDFQARVVSVAENFIVQGMRPEGRLRKPLREAVESAALYGSEGDEYNGEDDQ